MKKVLIITYYWPPGGGAGVQRWVKFVKYLRQYDWEPIVYTPSNAEFPETDNSYFKDIPQNIEVLKKPIIEPYNFYKRFIGQKKEVKISTGFLSEHKKKKLSEKISVWIRGNFFIPDAKMFWINPSVKYLYKYLTQNPVEAIISTGPPHSLHIIASKISKKLQLPWLADFRDPWTNIDFYKDLMLTKFANRKHKKMELDVLQSASVVTVISNSMREEFLRIHPANIEVITNGFDLQDYETTDEICLDEKFSIAHVGTIAKSRNPLLFWDALKDLVEEDKAFALNLEVKIIGKADISVWDSINRADLKKYVVKIEHVPHNEAIIFQRKSQLLLLSINDTPNTKSILTSKFFEYMAARRPILCIGPKGGDAEKIINETECGYFSAFGDKDCLKNQIRTLYSKYKENKLFVESKDIEKYSRKELTKKLAHLLDDITKKNIV